MIGMTLLLTHESSKLRSRLTAPASFRSHMRYSRVECGFQAPTPRRRSGACARHRGEFHDIRLMDPTRGPSALPVASKSRRCVFPSCFDGLGRRARTMQVVVSNSPPVSPVASRWCSALCRQARYRLGSYPLHRRPTTQFDLVVFNF